MEKVNKQYLSLGIFSEHSDKIERDPRPDYLKNHKTPCLTLSFTWCLTNLHLLNVGQL